MIVYKEIERRYTEKVKDKVICDICGKSSLVDFRENNFDAFNTVCYMKTGKNYPDCGFGHQFDINLCPDCFKNKLIPFVESFGISKIEEKEWEI